MAPRVVLSTRLNDAEHTRPVVQGLKDLTLASNDHQAMVDALARKLAGIKIPTLAEIQAALSVSGTNPLNITALVPGSGSTTSGDFQILVGLHITRRAMAAPPLTLFLETDRFAWYESQPNATWTFVGQLIGPFFGTVFSADQRPSDLGGQDNGFVFEGTDANGAVWMWNGAAWHYVVGTGAVYECTLSPNTKPTLGVNDVGFPIWSSDFHRLFLWSGAAWVEGQHNDARFQIGLFQSAPDQAGWFLCDGSTVSASTTLGSTAPYTTLNLAAAIFPRMNSVAAGTGGAATHLHSVDPPPTASGTESATHTHTVTPAAANTGSESPTNTGNESADTTVDNNLLGSTVQVAGKPHTHDMSSHTHPFTAPSTVSSVESATHTHTTDIAPFNSALASSLPPYLDLLPYVRL